MLIVFQSRFEQIDKFSRSLSGNAICITDITKLHTIQFGFREDVVSRIVVMIKRIIKLE